MGRRTRFFFAALAMGLAQGCIPVPVGPGASSPGSNGGYYGYPDYDRGYPDYDRGYGYDDERAWERAHSRYPCDKVDGRIAYDRAKIAEIDPTKHSKALRWYKDDLVNAERDKDNCHAYFHERREQAEWERKEREREERARLGGRHEQCRKLEDRIRYDRAKIAEIDPGKHSKALQWYKDDIVNAERDIANGCQRR